MKLAVVIPVYNHAHYVGAAIESCLKQTRRPDRILVIDDGSQDDSVAVCQRYVAQGVEVESRENRGAHETINELIKKAAQDCEVIAILNSDDFYAPTRFEKMLAVLDEDPTAQLVVSGLQYIDPESKPLPEDHPRYQWLKAVWSRWDEPDLDLAEWMGQANFPVTTSNVVARASFLLRFPFQPYHFNHDYYFLSQAAIRGVIRVIPDRLVHYRVHPTNTINTKPAPLMRELVRQHLDLYHDLAPELATDPSLRARFYRYVYGASKSVSAFHSGILQVVLAQSLQSFDAAAREKMAKSLDEAQWPELAHFPNKELVTQVAPGQTLGQLHGALGDKIQRLRGELDSAKEQATAWRELARLRQKLLATPRFRWGRLFGFYRWIDSDEGKTPTEKLARLEEKLATLSWWPKS